jgi:hypothetical protein
LSIEESETESVLEEVKEEVKGQDMKKEIVEGWQTERVLIGYKLTQILCDKDRDLKINEIEAG